MDWVITGLLIGILLVFVAIWFAIVKASRNSQARFRDSVWRDYERRYSEWEDTDQTTLPPSKPNFRA